MTKKITQTARFITPPNRLKAKMGSGGISAESLIRAQQHMDNNSEDFIPHGKKNLKRLNDFIQMLDSATKNEKKDILALIIQEIMDLKAHGSMFRYNLISMIANVTLDFLEKIESLNNDSIAIIKAHNKSLSVILNNQLKGTGGHEGQTLTRELREACERYHIKHETKS